MQLQQGFATGEMGFRGQFGQQQSRVSHVRFGSKADIAASSTNVRFTPKSGHWNSAASKKTLFDHLVGGREERLRNY